MIRRLYHHNGATRCVTLTQGRVEAIQSSFPYFAVNTMGNCSVYDTKEAHFELVGRCLLLAISFNLDDIVVPFRVINKISIYFTISCFRYHK